jgi:hypothetical protein
MNVHRRQKQRAIIDESGGVSGLERTQKINLEVKGNHSLPGPPSAFSDLVRRQQAVWTQKLQRPKRSHSGDGVSDTDVFFSPCTFASSASLCGREENARDDLLAPAATKQSTLVPLA